MKDMKTCAKVMSRALDIVLRKFDYDENSKEDDPKGNIRKELRRFITYDAISEFAFHVSGPLMMVYWLRDLHFDYIELAILINVSQLAGLFSLRYWGTKIDEK